MLAFAGKFLSPDGERYIPQVEKFSILWNFVNLTC